MRAVFTPLAVLMALLVSGCVTRGELKASLWLNNGMDPELCRTVPALSDYGFYRRLNDGRLEFISYCKPEAMKMSAVTDEDLNKILDSLLPKGNR